MQLTLFFLEILKKSIQYIQKFTSDNDANEVVNELFDSLSSRYQSNLETSMRGNDIIFESVQYYKCHKSKDWMKKKKVTTNPKITDDKCF